MRAVGHESGFGECMVVNRTDLSREDSTLVPVLESWNGTTAPWQHVRDPNDANHAFPVVEDVGVPVKGLLALMFVFAIVIGPVNLVVLTRKKRKLWLFWTVPLISFITCFTVISYMAVTEGWKGRSRIEGFTVLDENTRRASTLGWTGFYTPLLPSGGLHFSPETEVSYQNGEDSRGYSYSRRRSSGSALTIDWTRDQHFASGWLTPRVPAHFVLRKSELRRERMTISKGAEGLEVVNGLGADLSEFWYRDEAGNLFHADAIPAGGRASLTPTPTPLPIPPGGQSSGRESSIHRASLYAWLLACCCHRLWGLESLSTAAGTDDRLGVDRVCALLAANNHRDLRTGRMGRSRRTPNSAPAYSPNTGVPVLQLICF